MQSRNRALSELTNGALLLLSHTHDGRAHLVSLHRVRDGHTASLAQERFHRKFGEHAKFTPLISDVPASEQRVPVGLPAVAYDELSAAQLSAIREAHLAYPDGLPVRLLQSILSGAAGGEG